MRRAACLHAIPQGLFHDCHNAQQTNPNVELEKKKKRVGGKLREKLDRIHAVGFNICSTTNGQPILSRFNLPSCSFIQQHIHLSMMTYSVIRRDTICTHLSSSCIISSYFWMTLAPSWDSRHLQRRWDFYKPCKGYIQYLPSGQYSKASVLWGL